MASLHSSLYHGLIFVGFVEVFGIHLEDISIREAVKSDKGSEESFELSTIIVSVHKDWNISQLALFSFILDYDLLLWKCYF